MTAGDQSARIKPTVSSSRPMSSLNRVSLIADGSVEVPFRTFPLSDVAAAWTASAESGPRVVLVRD